MPDVSQSIRTRLLATSAVTDLVGQRIASDQLPQGVALPAITYFVVDTEANETLANIADVSRARIQVDSYATTRGQANSVSDAVRLALQMFRGLIGDQFINSIQLASGERHLTDPAPAGTDQHRFVTSLDFFVFYRTTTN